MDKDLSRILDEVRGRLSEAKTQAEASDIRVKYLGRKGEITQRLKSMKDMAPEERRQFGKEANEVKAKVEQMINDKLDDVKRAEKNAKLRMETIDVTEPGTRRKLGVKHPLAQTEEEIMRVFQSLGFSIYEGPEVETVFFNFDALNAPDDHPSRDLTDTFYISDNTLLRTHTSPCQARTLLEFKPPFKIVVPGRCFRRDTPDATHSPMFHQVEGIVVDEGITLADLKGTLDTFCKELFGPESRTKFRPHYFPFTEPSAEVDVSCFKCGGKGCNVCKGSGWIEILGCGETHPNVLKVADIDTEKYTAFAFGMGIERVAMLKYDIDDIRLLYENDVRFIEQFR
ncbi:MAG: phenylalanine--tRNA ligase subunit alpha [Anaerovoracaceae bacterium]|jgi:phenylalanyl-tRNA synthetase alpha chain